MHTSVVLLIILLEPKNVIFRPMANNMNIIFPWVGVLKVQQGNTEALTRLVLIGNRKAIGNANEISKLDKVTLRNSSIAIFFKNNIPWTCHVIDYLLHFEFHEKIYNTIAILNLNSTRKKWFPIHLPIKNLSTEASVRAIGLTDRVSKELEQSIFRMLPVNESKCMDFYKNEGLDFKNYWPKHPLCYKAANIKRGCVFDSGMALVVKHQGNWILTGIGILGPGCRFPSRYIELLPYVPWLNLHIHGEPQSSRRQYAMRTNSNNSTAIDPSKDIVSDSHGIEDDFYVHKINNATMFLWPDYVNVREEAFGDCRFNKGVKMYSDVGIVIAAGLVGVGVYALSLYDLRYNNVSCVMVNVKCKARSITRFWYEKGFRKDDFSQYVKTVPHPKNHNMSSLPPRVLFLKDYYHQYDNITTANVVFKFQFETEASIYVDFFGFPVTKPRYPL